METVSCSSQNEEAKPVMESHKFFHFEDGDNSIDIKIPEVCMEAWGMITCIYRNLHSSGVEICDMLLESKWILANLLGEILCENLCIPAHS